MAQNKPIIVRYTGTVTPVVAGTEVVILKTPPHGYITRIHVKTTAGGGTFTDLRPVLGNATNPADTVNQILQVAASAGQHIDEVPTQRIPYASLGALTSGNGSLFLRFVPSGGSGASGVGVSWELFIEPGF